MLALFGLLVVLAAAGILWLLSWAAPDNTFLEQKFSRAQWLKIGPYEEWRKKPSTKNEDSCPRGPMVGDLMDHHLPLGQSKAEILQLLGKAGGEENRPISYGGEEFKCLYYTLGFCHEIPLDIDVLSLCFDEDDRLIEKRLLGS